MPLKIKMNSAKVNSLQVMKMHAVIFCDACKEKHQPVTRGFVLIYTGSSCGAPQLDGIASDWIKVSVIRILWPPCCVFGAICGDDRTVTKIMKILISWND